MERYRQSNAWLEKAETLIPLGSQTFSKSRLQFPRGAAPLYIDKGKGAEVWDIDGHRYLDFVNGLLSVSLGYGDVDVDNAVLTQLKNGVTFSLPHRLEYEVAERLVDYIPCAEQVRFGKSGSDATSAAIRLARAYTGRERIAACGYHGWHDWYIGSTSRNLGVPADIKRLTSGFTYNDINSLANLFEQYPNQIAAVILEPVTFQAPTDNFLARVVALCEQQGAVCVFDEMITGFRFAVGGAQAYFNVTPHLACFGKGMANGYPLSAIVGQKNIMKLMDTIFFSGTFGGETLSLAAAKATIDKMVSHHVPEHFARLGARIVAGINALLASDPLFKEIVGIQGYPCWTALNFKGTHQYSAEVLKTYFIQAMCQQGILITGSHNLSYAHNDESITALLEAYKLVLGQLKEFVKAGTLAENIKGELLQPVFQVRAAP